MKLFPIAVLSLLILNLQPGTCANQDWILFTYSDSASFISANDYKVKLIRQIRRYWFPPKDGKIPTVAFTLVADGSVSNVILKHSSGIKLCDDAAMEAVMKAAPYPKLPKEIKSIQVSLQFDSWKFMSVSGR